MSRVGRRAVDATLLAWLAWLAGCGGSSAGADANDSESGIAPTTSTESGSDGFDTSTDGSTTDESSTDEPTPECTDYAAAYDCSLPAELAYPDCRADCPAWLLGCDDGACAADCGLALSSAKLECDLEHCGFPREETECVHECWTTFSSCIAAPNCDLHACQWELGPCLTSCVMCIINTELDFAYANSCELLLPEPVGTFWAGYTSLVLNGQQLWVEELPTACDDPQVGGIVTDDLISLCPATCEAFALAGVLRLIVSGPPCP